MSIIVTAPPATIQHYPKGRNKYLKDLCLDFVHCGMLVSMDQNALSGPGTKITPKGLVATISGYKKQYNKLCSVVPKKSKYSPNVGELVIGRVVKIQNTIWKVDVNHRLSAIMRLTNMNLPGGELRRKSWQDEISMNEYLVVGDLVFAEIQRISPTGKVELQIPRNFEHGKLGQGILIEVWPSLIKLGAKHLFSLFGGIELIIGDNGLIWISSGISSAHEDVSSSPLSIKKREIMVRIAACVRLLAKGHSWISYESILIVFKLSMPFKVKDLARHEIAQDLMSKLGQFRLILEDSETEEAQ